MVAFAADNPLSVHVLNQPSGLPAPGVRVSLELRQGERWQELAAAVTDRNGCISALFPEKMQMQPGTYRMTFHTGAWFKEQGAASFFPEIPVVFTVDGALSHYHIPLLLSQYGYST